MSGPRTRREHPEDWQRAEAAWGRVSRILIFGLAASAVVLALVHGRAGGLKFDNYMDAREGYQDLQCLLKVMYENDKKKWDEYENLKCERGRLEKTKIRHKTIDRSASYLETFKRLRGRDVLTLGEPHLKEAFKRLKKLEKTYQLAKDKEYWTLVIACEKLLEQAAGSILAKYQVRSICLQLQGNSKYTILLWKEADFGDINEIIITDTLKNISLIQRGLPPRFPVDKYTSSHLSLHDLWEEVDRDLGIMWREVTQLRMAYQGLELSLPLITILYWYPAVLLLFGIIVLKQVQQACEQTGGKLTFNQWIGIGLILGLNIVIGWHLYKTFPKTLPTLIAAAPEQKSRLYILDHKTWLVVVSTCVVLFLGYLASVFRKRVFATLQWQPRQGENAHSPQGTFKVKERSAPPPPHPHAQAEEGDP